MALRFLFIGASLLSCNAEEISYTSTQQDRFTKNEKNSKIAWDTSRNQEKIETQIKPEEIVQKTKTKQHYFSITLDQDGRVVSIHVFDKKSKKLLQDFSVSCQFIDEPLSIGDYNFDGHTDFSIFEGQYSGANTSSIYFLYDPINKHYFKSNFQGISLEFDSKKKIIHEYNSSAAGSDIEESYYRVVNNQMVLIRKTCKKYISGEDKYRVVPCDKY
ncbi:MAG: XAC2610-related protein [Ferruginibacter sp.]